MERGSGEATRSQPPGNKNRGVAGLAEGWWLVSEGVLDPVKHLECHPSPSHTAGRAAYLPLLLPAHRRDRRETIRVLKRAEACFSKLFKRERPPTEFLLNPVNISECKQPIELFILSLIEA
ncbi:unnamed protein product [Pleuronectes platessa]|uniref:Uncharacterized protein n=1 Tax=Pleuronectes platessa TaxID=8262 RepID=A0A9N7VW94_PLEPL|nr:unnamed protein product [Pleuronectes platessa]